MKCTSCGATTPGGPEDKWNSDFSLCASCEALRLKGVLLILVEHEKVFKSFLMVLTVLIYML